jgi:hypothetical protein
MRVVVYFISAFLLIVIAFAIFRIFVRRDYQRKGRLTLISGFLELLIWGLYMTLLKKGSGFAPHASVVE